MERLKSQNTLIKELRDAANKNDLHFFPDKAGNFITRGEAQVPKLIDGNRLDKIINEIAHTTLNSADHFEGIITVEKHYGKHGGNDWVIIEFEENILGHNAKMVPDFVRVINRIGELQKNFVKEFARIMKGSSDLANLKH